ncbi:MAG: dehydrogenase [Saprospiraceae bacterium]|nr:dehydrogenase [Saprospiraceae bacterium]
MKANQKLKLIFLWAVSLFLACEKGPSPALPPQESMNHFQLEEGLQIELVAAEPMIEEPVAITFDAKGQLWVVEMRGYMMNIDMEGEELPNGRIVVLSDENGDGRMDQRRVFADSLVMPRALAILSDGVLIAEKKPLWFYEDVDRDGTADRKILVDSIYGESGLPEHSPNGLWRGMDNWYYNAKATSRYKRINGQWVKEKTEFRGQWGLSHDDQGRLFYNYNWSQLHADLVPPNTLSRNPHHEPSTGIDHGLTIDRRIFPIRTNPAINRGYIPGTLNEEGRLIEFTSACSPFVYRGTGLTAAYQGNAFVCEPTGNLIKRNVVQSSGFQLTAYDPNPGREFLASSDERFRPVALTAGPDGAMYVADMYRGIVQHGAYMTPYLREQILARKLDRPVQKGRIWRISSTDATAPTVISLADVSLVECVSFLAHEDGWYRDMAQRILVEEKSTETIPLIEQLTTQATSWQGRLHALWTLEGMGELKPEVAQAVWQEDPNDVLRAHALRLLEPFLKKDKRLQGQTAREMIQVTGDASPTLSLQLALSAEALAGTEQLELILAIMDTHGEEALIRDALMSSSCNREHQLLEHLLLHPDWQLKEETKEIFIELLAAATFRKGDAVEVQSMLDFISKDLPQIDGKSKVILSAISVQAGLAQDQPIELRREPYLTRQQALLTPRLQGQITTLAKGLNWPGKPKEKELDGEEGLLDQEALKQFASGRQQYLSICAGCHGTDGQGLKRFGPPLVQSEWVLGDPRKLSLILLHGMEGPLEVNGKRYDAPDILPVMPSHSVVDDAHIAAILTYIRNEWGHQAGPVKRGLVGKTRVQSQGKVVPWKAEELQQLSME